MKTLTKSTFALLIAVLISTNIFADGFQTEEEAYIDDIPFNTKEIVFDTMYKINFNKVFDMEDESFDDIPFNTYEIASDEIHKLAMEQEFTMEDESYIDDIPFDTEEIAALVSRNDIIANK